MFPVCAAAGEGAAFMAIRESVDVSDDQPAQQDTLRAILTKEFSSVDLRSALAGEARLPSRAARPAGWRAGPVGLDDPGGVRRARQVPGRGVRDIRRTRPGPVSRPVPAQLGGGRGAAGDRSPRSLRAVAPSAGRRVGGRDRRGRRRGWPLAPGPGGVRADYGTGGWRLSGRRWYVVAAHVADIVVVPAVTESGLSMFLAETGSPGLEMSRQLDLDLTRRISIISFEAAPAVLLTKQAAAALALAEREFLIGTAAEAAGGIGWCLDASLAFVRDQNQFERPAGSFEALASFCVDMLADLEHVSAAARYAAAATDVSAADAQKAARVAALQAGDSYRRAAEAAIHLFGDIGFTQEHDAQLYYRRAWSAERLAGGPQAHRDALAPGYRVSMWP